MRRARRRRIVRGTLAGIAGGLAASWVMNLFISGVSVKLTQSLMSEEDRIALQRHEFEVEGSGQPEDDATVKAAEDVVHTMSGGQHLSHEERKKAGPIVHYVFGGLMGGLYGALAECSTWTSMGFGTVFGAVLYAAADVAAVPALGYGPSVANQPISAQATPLAAHVVYGATTDLVRRAIRAAA